MNYESNKQHKEEVQDKADLLKALSNPVRLCILQKLMHADSCTVTYFTSCMAASQSTISQHLAKLRTQNIVAVEREGTNAHYFIKDQLTKDILKLIFEEN